VSNLLASQGSANPAPTTTPAPASTPAPSSTPAHTPTPSSGQPSQGADPAPQSQANQDGQQQGSDQQNSNEPPRKSRSQQRIERLSRELRLANQDKQRLSQEVETYRSQPLKPLDPLKHASDDEWATAIAENTQRKTLEGATAAEAQRAATRAEQIETQLWNEKVAEYKKIAPDFEEVVYGHTAEVPGHLLKMIRGMENGPPVALFLVRNERELARISRMSERDAAFELGRLDSRMSATKPKRVSKAPDPVPTVSGGRPASGFRPDTNDPQAYRAWREGLK
jgi:hypothetical protein